MTAFPSSAFTAAREDFSPPCAPTAIVATPSSAPYMRILGDGRLRGLYVGFYRSAHLLLQARDGVDLFQYNSTLLPMRLSQEVARDYIPSTPLVHFPNRTSTT